MANENIEEKIVSDSSVSIHKTIDKTKLTNWNRPFWRTVISDEFGTGSTARVSSLAIIGVSLSIVVYLVVKTSTIPQNLSELGWFSSLLVTVVYSPSKIAGIFKSFANNSGKK